MRFAILLPGLLALATTLARGEESLERLSPLLGEWLGGEEDRDAHPFLSITGIAEKADGIWVETNARTRLNMGDWKPVRIHIAANGENGRVYAHVSAKAARGLNYELVSAAAGILVWEEVSRALDRTRVRMKPDGQGSYETTLQKRSGASDVWLEVRSVTYLSAKQRVSAAGVSFVIPRVWERGKPGNQWQEASLVLPPPPGADDSTPAGGLLLWDFGPEGRGPADLVFDRWITQVYQPHGKSTADDAEVGSVELPSYRARTLLISGTYAGPPRAQEGITVWAALVEPTVPDASPLYFKALGPKAVIAHWRAALDELLQSVQLDR